LILRDDEARAAWRWDTYFSPLEMACKHCRKLLVNTDLMDKLCEVRVKYGKAMIIASGYRCPEYNVRVSTTGPNGPHTMGAVDVSVRGSNAHELLTAALACGVRGIGVQQVGAARFLHLDMLTDPGHPRPWVWSY
jgi:zinc D-Ala-D-Ala carboxypeptidase